MNRYPLLFTYRDVIRGQDFTAHVTGHGHVLLAIEPGEGLWMYGVSPGAVSAFGETPDDAHVSFRILYREILNDIAAESATYAEFSANVSHFFLEENRPNAAEWGAALALVRAKDIMIEGLPKRHADAPWVKVEELIPMGSEEEPRFSDLAEDPIRALAA